MQRCMPYLMNVRKTTAYRIILLHFRRWPQRTERAKNLIRFMMMNSFRRNRRPAGKALAIAVAILVVGAAIGAVVFHRLHSAKPAVVIAPPTTRPATAPTTAPATRPAPPP